jgi:hypothetical protein
MLFDRRVPFQYVSSSGAEDLCEAARGPTERDAVEIAAVAGPRAFQLGARLSF